jgi:hypothetical protein
MVKFFKLIVASLFLAAAAFDRRFNAVVRVIASVNMALAFGVVFMVGFYVILGSGIHEEVIQTNLLDNGGLGALLAYQNQVVSHRMPLGSFMVESIFGHCYSATASEMGGGLWITLVVAPLVAVVIFLARIEVRMTDRARIKRHLDQVLAGM